MPSWRSAVIASAIGIASHRPFISKKQEAKTEIAAAEKKSVKM